MICHILVLYANTGVCVCVCVLYVYERDREKMGVLRHSVRTGRIWCCPQGTRAASVLTARVGFLITILIFWRKYIYRVSWVECTRLQEIVL